MASRGRRPRGDRVPTSFKAPRDHLAIYRAAADEAGLPLGDYLVIALAERHELPLPEYLDPQDHYQQELPLGA